MWNLLRDIGLDGAWLPTIVSLVLIPSLYIILAIDVHKEYADVIHSLVEKGEKSSPERMTKLLVKMKQDLHIFELDWWIVAAFGLLIVVIVASGHITGRNLPRPIAASVALGQEYECLDETAGRLTCVQAMGHPQNAVPAVALTRPYECLDELGGRLTCLAQSDGVVSNVMAGYATLIGLMIGFRLAWARLNLARRLKRYYALVETA